MENVFSTWAKQRARRQAALAVSLLAATASPAFAQIPSTIYVLGKTLITNGSIPVGSPIYFEINPANLATTTVGDLNVAGSERLITGLLDINQPLLAIDVRPSTGQIYALAYNASTQLAQLYTLNTSTNALTAVGGSISLNLQDANNGAGGSNAGNTIGTTTNVGFDFNPRLDRIRVVAPNGTNYVLNPNTGTLQATNTPLTYTAPAYAGRTPYIGAAAYTNSQVGLAGTTLYDVDVANTNGLLARQEMPGNGTLDQAAPLHFALRQAGGAYDLGPTSNGYPLTSPTNRIDLDVAYDRAGATNRYYVLESRYRSAGGFSLNLYEVAAADVLANTLTNTPITAYGENVTGNAFVNYYDMAVFSKAPKTWTGQAGTNWADGGNWFPAGTPTSTDDVFVPGNGFVVPAANFTVAQQPTVSGTQNAGSITLGGGAVLTLANGSVLNNYGNFANNESTVQGDAAAANGGTGTLALVGTATQEISGNTSTTFPNLSVGAAGATTTAAVSIQRSLAVSGNLGIGADQGFTLLSSASGTAYVANNGGIVTGLATVQRYITPTNPGAGYRHYSSPVTRNTAAATSNTVADLTTAGFAPTVNAAYNSATEPRLVQPYPTIFSYDQSRLATSNASYAVGDFDNGFVSPSALTSVLVTGRGYTVNIGGTQLVDFQGTLNTGSYSTGPLARGAQSSAGWHLLGNPYPGAISYAAVIGASAGMEDALYVYKSNGQYTGAYSSYLSNGQAVNGGTNNIALGQGFFLRVQPGNTGNVSFNNTARTNQPETALFQRPASPAPALALTLSGNNVANQTRVYFQAGATSAFDNGYDAHYLAAAHGLDLASDIITESLAINGLPLLTGAAVAVPLRLHAAVAGTYTLTVDELTNLPAGYHAYLRDGSTGSYTDLATVPSLSLTLAPADAATGRYAIVFGTAQPLAAAPAALAALVGVYPNPAHGTATLVLPQALRGQAGSEVTLLNMLGQVVLRRQVSAGSPEAVELPLSNLAAGIYTVRATTATGTVAKQLRVE